jgi:error-prone DNA polymerase
MRAVVLARGGPGWRPLCRLVSAAHADRRGDPLLSDPQQCADAGLVVLMGYDSPIGRALQGRRPDLADALLRQWWERGVDVRVAVTSHRAQSGVDSFGCPAPSGVLAARMLGWADQHGLSTVLTHTVRYATPDQARTVDVLDAVRRLVPLDRRHRARANAFGYLADTATMEQIADEIVTAAGLPTRAVQALLGRTRELAVECALSPYDIGIGSIHVPEAELLVPGGEQITPGTLSRVLRDRCHSAIAERYPEWERRAAEERLDDEVRTIDQLGFAGYFLTVAEVVDLSRRSGIRVAARGSGAGSLVTYLLGISGIDPLRHGLLMERFLTPLRRALPDIDIDVESARRTDVYDLILDRFGAHRIACVSMMETYRARHALRDVGAALSLPRSEIDALAKAVPHIRARNVRAALTDLPEVRRSGLGQAAARGDLDDLLDLVEALDGLPRHVAMHPCGVLLSDATLLDRVPVEASAAGYPMCQFDKDDVEEVGLLKLDVLGIRMQSAIAHALDEIARIDGELVDIDRVPLDDRPTFELISSARTLGCFQIESPGQRELIGKFAPETFNDLVIDISLFRPGPVKSDMVTPFLRARQGWCAPVYPHDDLRPALAETFGVVVFHEQVLRIVATMTGCTLAEADETRRSMNTPEGMDDVRAWFYPAALRRGYDLDTVDRVWDILRAFASFGFCKAHAAAFALPTYQSAWLKTHHPAAFFAGILTYDPGMYPKRLILDDARTMGIEIRGVDVNSSAAVYSVECEGAQCASRTGYALRIALSEVKGISAAEVDSILGARPYTSLPDFWYRTDVSRPVVERLVLAGAFDSVYGIGTSLSRRRITRRDLLLQVADLDRLRGGSAPVDQLAFDIGGAQDVPRSTGLPDMSVAERVRAEVEILGLDVSQHLIRFYEPMLAELSLARARDLLRCRAEQVVWVAGVKVATQTPPVRSGRRVVFVTVDDATGPIDATFFEDAQAQYAPTIFHSWLLMIRGHVRRTGPRGVSLRATGCWDLPTVHEAWLAGGVGAVHALLQPEAAEGVADGPSIARRVLVHASGFRQSPYADTRPAGPDIRRLWHASPGSSG